MISIVINIATNNTTFRQYPASCAVFSAAHCDLDTLVGLLPTPAQRSCYGLTERVCLAIIFNPWLVSVFR